MKNGSPTRFRQTDAGERENVINICTPSLADRSNQLFRWLVLSRRCRDVSIS
jgi:hypothetical protein